MSIYIPENMEEVAMKVAQNQVHGRQVSPDEVIHDAVLSSRHYLMMP